MNQVVRQSVFVDPGEAGPLLLGGEVGGWLSFFLEAPLAAVFKKPSLMNSHICRKQTYGYWGKEGEIN